MTDPMAVWAIYLTTGAVYVGWVVRCDKDGRAYVARESTPGVIFLAILLFIVLWPIAAIQDVMDAFKRK